MSLTQVDVEQRPDPKRLSARTLRILVVIGLGIYAAWSVAPLILMIANAFRDSQAILSNPVGMPGELTISNFVEAWSRASFGIYMKNSVFITISAVALGTAVSLLASYAFSRFTFSGRKALMVVFFMGLILPVRFAILPLFRLMDTLSLVDSQVGLILLYAATGIPFSILVLIAFLRQVPQELEDAAAVDGAGVFRTLWSIVVPVARPAIAVVAAFQFVPVWNDFFYPLILLRTPSKATIPVGLTYFFGQYQTDWATLFAGLTIATLPLFLVFALATRQIVAGLTAGITK